MADWRKCYIVLYCAMVEYVYEIAPNTYDSCNGLNVCPLNVTISGGQRQRSIPISTGISSYYPLTSSVESAQNRELALCVQLSPFISMGVPSECTRLY